MTTVAIPAPTIIPLRRTAYGSSHKFSINTEDLIEISCEHDGVEIYYTLDGRNPDVISPIHTFRSTIYYEKPFRIENPRPGSVENATAGKEKGIPVTVKAIAVTKDRKHKSQIVTKNFRLTVPKTTTSHNEIPKNPHVLDLQEERKKQLNAKEENKSILKNSNNDIEQATARSTSESRSNRFLDHKLQNPITHTARLQEQTDFLRCSQCFAPRIGELHAAFCNECGSPWQPLTPTETKLNHSDARSLGTCANCKTTVPFNAKICAVCETPLTAENQHRINIQNHTKLLCPHCKASNPVHLRTCMICENKLMPSTSPQVQAAVSVPIAPLPNGTLMTCSKCFRLNNADARFCDWCGVKPERTSIPLECTKCRSENDPYAKFCTTCGCVIEPPLRIIHARIRNDLTISPSLMIPGAITRYSNNPTWLNPNATFGSYRQPYLITKTDISTQTQGIFYKSAKEIDASTTQSKRLQADYDSKERRPILTAVSPGKGYWRQQIDHICAHLKAFVVNEPKFRSLIGELKLGKISGATTRKVDSEVKLELVFRDGTDSGEGLLTSERKQLDIDYNDRRSTISTTAETD